MKLPYHPRLFCSVLLMAAVVFLISCRKETDGNPSHGNTPRTSVPAPLAGNWSSSSIGLFTYWDQGSYAGSNGDLLITLVLNPDGTGYYYGYYQSIYGSSFYRYNCSLTYEEAGDGSVSVTMYPYSGEMQYNNGPRKKIGAADLYPNNYFKLNNCSVYSNNGKTYLQYFHSNASGEVFTDPTVMQRL